MDQVIQNFKSQTSSAVTNLENDLKGIRTGRANPGMIENMNVETYGGTTTLRMKEIAGITTEGPATLVVSPFDPATTQDIEKAIMASPIGINPQTEGAKIFLKVPPMSEEQRTKYSKVVSTMVEETKNTIRRHRDDSRKTIKRLLDDKQVSEDIKFRGEKEIDSLTTDLNQKLQTLKEKKEKEIMEV